MTHIEKVLVEWYEAAALHYNVRPGDIVPDVLEDRLEAAEKRLHNIGRALYKKYGKHKAIKNYKPYTRKP